MVVDRQADRCWIDAVEPEFAEIERIDEHIDRANRIAHVDPFRGIPATMRAAPAAKPVIDSPTESVGDS